MTTIARSAQRMDNLIDDLLSFSRMGRQEMCKTQVNLAYLAQEVIQEIMLTDEKRSIEWRIGNLLLVTGDQPMLRIVLVNLLSNAVKYTRTREQAKIEIDALPVESAEQIFYVRDNGVGFDMAYAGKLFGVFQRLHRPEEFEGTGIGLAIVRQIIDRHGGRTWAESQVDQGATFYFSLPIQHQATSDKRD